MNAWITEFINQFGYFAIALLIALENVFPPLPSEIILTMSGFMTTTTSLSIVGVIIAATIGSLIGALILYALGRQLTVKRLERLLSHRLFKLLGFHQDDAKKAVDWFNKHGTGGILYGRCIPVIRSLISIPAGMSEMPMQKFLLYTILGSLIWNTVLIIVGSIVGDKWETIVGYLDNFSNIILIILVIIFVVAMYYWFVIRKKKQSKKA